MSKKKQIILKCILNEHDRTDDFVNFVIKAVEKAYLNHVEKRVYDSSIFIEDPYVEGGSDSQFTEDCSTFLGALMYRLTGCIGRFDSTGFNRDKHNEEGLAEFLRTIRGQNGKNKSKKSI